MLDDFLTRACLAGIGVALAAGPLGCFVVWRRIAYFGDATAHAGILGVAISLAFSMSTVIGVLAAAVAMAVAVSTFSGRGLAMDTLLGVASHGSLAVGLVAVAVASPRAHRCGGLSVRRNPGCDARGPRGHLGAGRRRCWA